MPFPDALQEFKVETGATGIQTGVKAAGSVSLVTKSGTNQWHGDAFEFVRNFVFNARNAFAPSGDGLKRNQFGGTLGGAILQNKLFFFTGYQQTMLRITPSDQTAVVPTAAMACINGFTTRPVRSLRPATQTRTYQKSKRLQRATKSKKSEPVDDRGFQFKSVDEP